MSYMDFLKIIFSDLQCVLSVRMHVYDITGIAVPVPQMSVLQLVEPSQRSVCMNRIHALNTYIDDPLLFSFVGVVRPGRLKYRHFFCPSVSTLPHVTFC